MCKSTTLINLEYISHKPVLQKALYITITLPNLKSCATESAGERA